MEFEQVLDAVILDNRELIRLDHDYFLPVNLVKSEDKLLKILNLVGLFLHDHLLISAVLSITSAAMGFSTNIRLCVHRVINRPLCWEMHMLFNLLHLFLRNRVYFHLNCVDNLKPGNDLELKTGKGELSPLIAGGGKARYQSVAHPSKLLSHVKTGERGDHVRYVLVDKHSNGSLAACPDKIGPFYFKCGTSFYIEWIFHNEKRMCSLKAASLGRAGQKSLIPHDIYFYIACGDDDFVEKAEEDDIKIMTCDHCAVEKLEEGVEYKISVFADVYCGSAPALGRNLHTSSVDINCGGKEAVKLFKLALCMAQQSSGTLKSYEGGGETVSVRRFTESINA